MKYNKNTLHTCHHLIDRVRLISGLLIVFLLASSLTFAGCSMFASDSDDLPEVVVNDDRVPDYSLITYTDDTSILPDDLIEMDEILKCSIMALASTEVYYSSTPSFQFWYMITPALMDNAVNHPGAELRDDDVYVSKKIIDDYGEAIFADYDKTAELPECPPGFTTVFYHEDEALFSFPNDALSEDISINISECAVDENGDIHLIATLLHKKDPQGTFRVDLQKTESTDSHYPYRIYHMETKTVDN